MKVCPTCGAEYGDDAAFCERDRSALVPQGGDLIGQVLADRYQIERKIGEGGMGVVYLARHVLMGRLSAVKVMSPTLARDSDATGRFNREATNASRINHPNVCAVYDFGLTSDGLLYLAMEYLEGRTLSAALAKGPLPLDQAIAIATQCAAGLAAAHELGIVHRDLKPDNVMLLEQHGREKVKLVDFGIAKAGTGEDAQQVTRTGLIVGTPKYMSPEQLSGDAVDGRSDQYSLALVFYAMVAGALPFEATSAAEMMAKRLTERPRALTDIVPATRFPPGLQAVLDRALQRSPERRYPTVEEFGTALDAAGSETASGRSIALPRTTIVRPAPRWRLVALAAGGLVVAGAGWGLWQVGQPGSLPPPATPPPVVGPAGAETDSAFDGGTQRGPDSPAPNTPPGPVPEPVGERFTLADLPRIEDFEPTHGAAAVSRAIDRATRAERQTDLGDSVRSVMAALIGQAMLDQGRLREAKYWVTRGCNRFPSPSCDERLAMFKDQVP